MILTVVLGDHNDGNDGDDKVLSFEVDPNCSVLPFYLDSVGSLS